MFGIEIHKSLGRMRIPPDLAQDTGVWHAHQLLANDVHAVRDVETNNVVFVLECSFAFGFVVVVIEVQSLSEEVQAVEVVQSFDVGGESAAVFGVDLDLVEFQSGGCGFLDWDGYTSVCEILSEMLRLVLRRKLTIDPN